VGITSTERDQDRMILKREWREWVQQKQNNEWWDGVTSADLTTIDFPGIL